MVPGHLETPKCHLITWEVSSVLCGHGTPGLSQ